MEAKCYRRRCLVAPGLPLTFHTQTGEVVSVFALKKPLELSNNKGQPMKIGTLPDGHAKDLGIEAGWTLSGIGYMDITQMPYAEADKLLQERVDKLPFAIPLTFKMNNGKSKTTYAYQQPLGLTFDHQLPIKITKEEEGHAKHLGIEIGWELLAVNYINLQSMTIFEEVSAIAHREVSKIPSK